MRLRSRGKYWEKFWELIQKFQDVITNKILGLTHRERNLLDKMKRENEEKKKSSISYIIVRKIVLLVHLSALFCFRLLIKERTRTESCC